jgi:hypothetical protein
MFDTAYKKMLSKYKVMRKKVFHTNLTGDDIINMAGLKMLEKYGTDGAESTEHYTNLFNKNVYWMWGVFLNNKNINKWAVGAELNTEIYGGEDHTIIDREFESIIKKSCPILNYSMEGYTQMEIAKKIERTQPIVRKRLMREQDFLREHYGLDKK